MKRSQFIILLPIFILVMGTVWKIQTAIRSKNTHGKPGIVNAGITSSSLARPIDPRMTKIYDSSKIEMHHPFIVYHDGSFLIACEIETAALMAEYQPIFDQYGLSGNGYSWEGIIYQILKKERRDLVNHIELDPEAGGFYAYADNPKAQREFAVYFSSIFSDHQKLHQALKKIDRSQISD